MRLFISIELPEEVKDELWKLQEGFKDLAKVKWVAKKNYHICLKFLGEVSESKVEKIKSALKTIKFNSFSTSLNKIGVFPHEGHVNVIWVDVEPADKVINLQSEIEDSLKDLFKRDNRFAVHITLGRVKSIADKKEFIEKLKGLSPNKINFKIEKFHLVESKLSKEGPKYKILEKI